MHLLRTDLRLATRHADIDLRSSRTELKIHQQREVLIGDSSSTEHFKLIETRQFFKHMKVNVVETRIEERSSSVFALNLRQRITTIRQQPAFGAKRLRDKVFPRAAIDRQAKRQRIQEQSDDALAVSRFRPAIRNEAGDDIMFAADRAQNFEMRGKQHALERHTG